MTRCHTVDSGESIGLNSKFAALTALLDECVTRVNANSLSIWPALEVLDEAHYLSSRSFDQGGVGDCGIGAAAAFWQDVQLGAEP